MPERWHADNGGEFVNHFIDAVRELLAANSMKVDGMLLPYYLPYSHSMPRNPQCQGLVERGNRTIKNKIPKMMTQNGYVQGVDMVFEWRPYLDQLVQKLNRTVVKLYRFSPCVMMTGQPPEAPDHISLSPEDLRRLHEYCALAMRRQAAGMTNEAFCESFKCGDIVMVHKVKKRSHLDHRAHGAKSYPARAVVVKQSTSNENHYQIRWTTDGLHGKEKAGDVSTKMWPSWMLKLCKDGPAADGGDAPPADCSAQQTTEAEIHAEVLASVRTSLASDDDSAADAPPVQDAQAIFQIAERCVCV